MMGYGGGDLLQTGAVWPAVGSLPGPVCGGCGQWPVWPAAPGTRDESALEVAPPDRRLDRRPSAFTTMSYTNRQPLPLPFLGDHVCNQLFCRVGHESPLIASFSVQINIHE